MAPEPSYPLPAHHPFVGMDAWRLLSLRAAASPAAPFLTWHPFDGVEGNGRTWSYGEFARDALAVAAGLRRRGVRAGHRVLIHLENCPEFLLAWFGCAALGAVAVTTNARSAADELRYYASDSEPAGAITQPRFADLVAAAAPRLSWLVSLDADPAQALEIRGVPGLSMFAEYLNKPDATAGSYDEDGWFRTGDLVTVHADGWITFADRAKDMLRVGSENVAASEIERVIAEVPGVAEAAVVARPDVKLDEVPVAFVVAAGPAAGDALAGRVIAACAAKLADFKVPHQVTIVAALPRSTISKVNKTALRTVLTSGGPLEQAERNWLAEAAADPSGDAP